MALDKRSQQDHANTFVREASPRVRVRVSLGGTKPKLRAMAFDMRGAVLPEDPGLKSSPKSPEAILGRLLAPVGDVKLPADAQHC